MKVLMMLLALLLNFLQSAHAHEGHAHAPGALIASEGGVVKCSKLMCWEIVNDSSNVKLFPRTLKNIPMSLTELEVTTTSTDKKNKLKNELPILKKEDKFYSTKIDLKGSSHYTLAILATVKGKNDDLITFVIEAQE